MMDNRSYKTKQNQSCGFSFICDDQHFLLEKLFIFRLLTIEQDFFSSVTGLVSRETVYSLPCLRQVNHKLSYAIPKGGGLGFTLSNGLYYT